MPDFPIILHLQNRLCVVIGGGPVGLRKAGMLRAAGARVRLVSPFPGPPPDLAGIEAIDRPYRSGDLEGAFLAVAAAGDREVNAAVVGDARAAGVLVNVADLPEEGDFTLPAVLRRGDLTVAVSTAGRSPALSALVREHLAGVLGPEWAVALEIAAAVRQKKLTPSKKTEYNREILRQMLDGGLLPLIAGRQVADIDRLLHSLCGAECSLAQLGVLLPRKT